MDRPQAKRNGKGEGQEMSQDATIQAGVDAGLITSPVSPAPKTESPVKQVVFKSVDFELVLHQRAGYMDKSKGIVTYVPGTGVQFKEGYVRFDDTPANAVTIKWLREHESNGVKFKEVPDLSNVVELPTITQMKDMSIGELKELCVKNVVTINESDSKEAIILALIQKV